MRLVLAFQLTIRLVLRCAAEVTIPGAVPPLKARILSYIFGIACAPLTSWAYHEWTGRQHRLIAFINAILGGATRLAASTRGKRQGLLVSH